MTAAVSGGKLKRVRPMLLPVVLSLFVLSACAAGNKLYIPGEIARPPFSGPPPEGKPLAAVSDFSYALPEEGVGVIGRDFDRARPIVWAGQPGKSMADLVSGALGELGVPTVRGVASAPTPRNIPFRITGIVRRFEMNVHRRGVVKVTSEAVVSVSVAVTGAGMPAPWETTVTSSASMEDVFPNPEELQRVLQTAANTAANEAVRRMKESGLVDAFRAGGGGGSGTAR